jgi:putative transposase
MPGGKRPKIPGAILDQLLAGVDLEGTFDPNGLLDELKEALAGADAEMDHHLSGDEAKNSRNGYGRKTMVTGAGRLDLEVPLPHHRPELAMGMDRGGALLRLPR